MFPALAFFSLHLTLQIECNTFFRNVEKHPPTQRGILEDQNPSSYGYKNLKTHTWTLHWSLLVAFSLPITSTYALNSGV